MQRLRRAALFSALFWPLACLAQHLSKLPNVDEHSVDLRPSGFPADPNPTVVADVKAGIFFLSKEIVGLYFEQRVPDLAPQSHSYKFLTFNTNGQMLAQRPFRVDGNLLDVGCGPNESILFRELERLDFFDSRFQLVKTHPLPTATTGIRFDRTLKQIVVTTADEESGNQKARFLRADTLDEFAALNFPKHARVIFGEARLGYTLPGWCKGALHVEPENASWQNLTTLQTCDALTFVGNEALAYATNQDLYLVHKSGKELFHGHIPAPDSFHLPDLVGLSDDHSRLAVMAIMKRSIFAVKPGTWPYYNEVYIYDLNVKKLLFKHALSGGYAAALSPDGHHLATIESGNLRILSIP
jgi:hypothetical protein